MPLMPWMPRSASCSPRGTYLIRRVGACCTTLLVGKVRTEIFDRFYCACRPKRSTQRTGKCAGLAWPGRFHGVIFSTYNSSGDIRFTRNQREKPCLFKAPPRFEGVTKVFGISEPKLSHPERNDVRTRPIGWLPCTCTRTGARRCSMVPHTTVDELKVARNRAT